MAGSLILDSQCTTHCDPDKRHIGNIGDLVLCATTAASCAPLACAAGILAGGGFGVGSLGGANGRGAGYVILSTAIAGGILGCGACAPFAGIMAAEVKNGILGTRSSPIFGGLLGLEDNDETGGNQKLATSLLRGEDGTGFSIEGIKKVCGKLSEKSSKKTRKKDAQASAGQRAETAREPLLGNEQDSESEMPSTSHAEERNTSPNEKAEEATLMELAGQLSRQISKRLLGNEQDSDSEMSSTSHPEEPKTSSNESKVDEVALTEILQSSNF